MMEALVYFGSFVFCMVLSFAIAPAQERDEIYEQIKDLCRKDK